MNKHLILCTAPSKQTKTATPEKNLCTNPGNLKLWLWNSCRKTDCRIIDTDCTVLFVPSISFTHCSVLSPADDVEGVAIQLEDGRIGYIYGETLLQAMAENQDPMFTTSKFVCRFPNCDKSYSSVNHLRVRIGGGWGCMCVWLYILLLWFCIQNLIVLSS